MKFCTPCQVSWLLYSVSTVSLQLKFLGSSSRIASRRPQPLAPPPLSARHHQSAWRRPPIGPPTSRDLRLASLIGCQPSPGIIQVKSFRQKFAWSWSYFDCREFSVLQTRFLVVELQQFSKAFRPWRGVGFQGQDLTVVIFLCVLSLFSGGHRHHDTVQLRVRQHLSRLTLSSSHGLQCPRNTPHIQLSPPHRNISHLDQQVFNSCDLLVYSSLYWPEQGRCSYWIVNNSRSRHPVMP